MYFGELPPKLIGLGIYCLIVSIVGAFAFGLILSAPQPHPELSCVSEVLNA